MIVFAIARHVLRTRRTMTLATMAGIALLGFLTGILYADFEETLAEFEVPTGTEGLFGEGLDPASPEGFLQSQFFGFVPVIVIAIGITIATYAIAGEERDGTLELALAQPVLRWQYVGGVALALVVITAGVVLAGFPALLAARAAIDMDIGVAPVWWATVAMFPTSLLFNLLALWFGAALPTRAAAAMGAAAVTFATYIVYVIGPVNGIFDALRRVSPFYWGDTARPIAGTYDPERWVGLLVVAAVLSLLAMRSLERREITGGNREWSLREAFSPRRWRRAMSGGGEAVRAE